VPSKTLAVALSAALGIVCGVVGSFTIAGARGPTAFADPLNLGIPYQNQSCTGKSLILVGSGGAISALSSAIQDNTGSSVRYLRTDRSCPTAWVYQPTNETQKKADPTWVVYLGPFDHRDDACTIRMTAEHKGDFVTALRRGNSDMLQCACYFPLAKIPTLTPGMTNTAVTSIWIRQLQQMLVDIGQLPKATKIDGFYNVGSATERAVQNEQTARSLNANGIVDSETWQLIKTRACAGYTS
jgi:hypothetical protein